MPRAARVVEAQGTVLARQSRRSPGLSVQQARRMGKIVGGPPFDVLEIARRWRETTHGAIQRGRVSRPWLAAGRERTAAAEGALLARAEAGVPREPGVARLGG